MMIGAYVVTAIQGSWVLRGDASIFAKLALFIELASKNNQWFFNRLAAMGQLSEKKRRFPFPTKASGRYTAQSAGPKIANQETELLCAPSQEVQYDTT
jgi:hypothetical protein